MSQHEYACPFCVAPDGVLLLWDKRGKPYMKCVLCGVRAFMPTARSLRGLALVEPYVRHIAEQAKTDPVAAARDDAAVDVWRAGLQERRQQLKDTFGRDVATEMLERKAG